MSELKTELEPETIDGETGLPEGPAPSTGSVEKRIELANLRDVRLEMAAVYREVRAKRLESQDGSRRVYMLRQIADVIINTELEQRVAELEARAALPRTGQQALRAVG